MKKSSSSTTNSGIGFTGLLTIVFITLKLTGVIAWPWWWVLSPLWISVLLVVALFVVVSLNICTSMIIRKLERRI